jgi:CBS domain-containing protein
MTGVKTTDLATFLAKYAPFDSVDRYGLATIAEAARLENHAAGETILNAFVEPTGEVLVVMSGRVDIWNHADRVNEPADEHLEPGELFGFSAMLTERPVGPLAVAAEATTIARIPGSVVLPAFASVRGARFLAEEVSSAIARVEGDPSYSSVDELIVRPPLVVEPSDSAAAVAKAMTEHGVGYAVVRLGPARFGLVTDLLLRQRILVDGLPPNTPAEQVMDSDAPSAQLGDSAAEALIVMFDRDTEFLLVTDRAGELSGVVTPRDFAVSPTTAGVALHEQLRRADTLTELEDRARRMPVVIGDLVTRGLASERAIAVYASMRDTTVRRAIEITFADHPELSIDAFTWLSLGSNGRREAVLSSDLDSAAAFNDETSPEQITAYLAVFNEVNGLLARSGLRSDDHGASTQRAAFSRTNADWRAAGEQWLAEPAKNQGAMMTSLLVDGRPVYGDPGLPAVTKVFADLRRHPGTMRLLLQESLSKRAKLRSIRDVLARRADTFDIKHHALLPISNIARWAALSVGAAALPTTERLRAAAGSTMLPRNQAENLIEVFNVLQRLRLLSQLEQSQAGETPSDILRMDRVSPLDRSVIAQAVREISAVQRRMDNVSAYLTPDAWVKPAPS